MLDGVRGDRRGRPRGLIQRTRHRRLAPRMGAAVALLVGLAGLAAHALASPGEPDRSFGERGIVTTAFPGAGSEGSESAAVLVRDGGIIAVGSSDSDFALARYNDDGSLDASFGDGGLSTTDLGGNDEARAAALEPDGGIVVAGSSGARAAIARYGPDGSLDPSFGEGGRVISAFAGAARAIALAPDGKIVVAGGPATTGDCLQSTVARYNPDGSLDSTFGGAGEVSTRLGCAKAVSVQADGGIVVAGSVASGGDRDFGLARFGPDGSLDRSFGDGGLATTDLGGNDEARAEVLEPDGGIVAAGSSGTRAALARYRPDGSLDRSFGEGGTVLTRRPGGERAKAVLLQPDGRIVVVGTGRVPGSPTQRSIVARYEGDGSLDTTFGDRGRTISKPAHAEAAVLEPDGRIVIAGSSAPPGPSPGLPRFAVGRLEGGRIASAPTPVTSADQRQEKRRRPRARAPRSVPAWYINADNFTELKRFAATDTCAFARGQPRAAQRTLILDVGGARAYRGGSFGAALNHEAFKATNKQIGIAMKVASDAYASCHRHGQARIVYANTNHFETKGNAHLARRIGVHQARTMHHVRAYQRRHGYGRIERAGIAGDIEMGFWGPSQSKELVNGAKSAWGRGYVDFGTAGGCPPYPKGLHLHGCFNGWNVKGVARVSHGRGGNPVPEIYFRGGPRHFDQAAQWSHVAKVWNAGHGKSYRFSGATGSTEFSNLSPGESWKLLRTKAPARVERELLNFKQDQFAKSAAKGG